MDDREEWRMGQTESRRRKRRNESQLTYGTGVSTEGRGGVGERWCN